MDRYAFLPEENKMRTRVAALVVAVPVLVALVAVTYSQEPNVDRVTVPFSDPSRPRSVRVNLLDGGITVKGYDGKDVIVEARPRSSDARRRSRREENTEGLRRLENPSTGLSVE